VNLLSFFLILQIGVLNYQDLISYARRLGPYTSAPPNFKLKKGPDDPPDDFPVNPPIPQDSLLRASLLFQQQNLSLQIPSKSKGKL